MVIAFKPALRQSGKRIRIDIDVRYAMAFLGEAFAGSLTYNACANNQNMRQDKFSSIQ
jgi:hypothetical protein